MAYYINPQSYIRCDSLHTVILTEELLVYASLRLKWSIINFFLKSFDILQLIPLAWGYSTNSVEKHQFLKKGGGGLIKTQN